MDPSAGSAVWFVSSSDAADEKTGGWVPLFKCDNAVVEDHYAKQLWDIGRIFPYFYFSYVLIYCLADIPVRNRHSVVNISARTLTDVYDENPKPRKILRGYVTTHEYQLWIVIIMCSIWYWEISKDTFCPFSEENVSEIEKWMDVLRNADVLPLAMCNIFVALFKCSLFRLPPNRNGNYLCLILMALELVHTW